MSYREALETALDGLTMQEVQDVVEDPELVDAYRTVLITDRTDVEAALAAEDTMPAPGPAVEQPTPAAEFESVSGDLATTDTGEQVGAAVRACDDALQELDDADTAAAEQEHSGELARWDADEQDIEHDAGQGLDQD